MEKIERRKDLHEHVKSQMDLTHEQLIDVSVVLDVNGKETYFVLSSIKDISQDNPIYSLWLSSQIKDGTKGFTYTGSVEFIKEDLPNFFTFSRKTMNEYFNKVLDKNFESPYKDKIRIVEQLEINDSILLKKKVLDYYDQKATPSEMVTLESFRNRLEDLTNAELKYIGDESLFILKGYEVIGFLTLGGVDGFEELEEDGFTLILNEVFVFPEYRGNGYGKKMMKKMEKILDDEKIFLTPTTDAENGFYEKLGYIYEQEHGGYSKKI